MVKNNNSPNKTPEFQWSLVVNNPVRKVCFLKKTYHISPPVEFVNLPEVIFHNNMNTRKIHPMKKKRILGQKVLNGHPFVFNNQISIKL